MCHQKLHIFGEQIVWLLEIYWHVAKYKNWYSTVTGYLLQNWITLELCQFFLCIFVRSIKFKIIRCTQHCNSVSLNFIHLVVCLTTGPKPLPKPALHIVQSRASSFKWEYPLLSLRSSNSFIRLLPCLLVTSIPPCIFPSVTRCRRQFDAKCDQSSSPSVYVFHVGYSSAPWL